MRHFVILLFFLLKSVSSQSLAPTQVCVLRCTATCLHNSNDTPEACQSTCTKYNSPTLCSTQSCWDSCNDLGAGVAVNATPSVIQVNGKKLTWQKVADSPLSVISFKTVSANNFDPNDILLTSNNSINFFDFPGISPCDSIDISIASVFPNGVSPFSPIKQMESPKPAVSPKLSLEQMVYENKEYVNDFYKANGTIRVVFRYYPEEWPLGIDDLVVEPMFHLINCVEPDLSQGMPMPEFTSGPNNTLVGFVGSDMMYRKCRFLYYAQGVTSAKCDSTTYIHSPSPEAMQTLNINCDTVDKAPCTRVERYQAPICGQVDDIEYHAMDENLSPKASNLTLNVTFTPNSRANEEPTIYVVAFYGNATTYKTKEEETFLGVNITHLMGNTSNCQQFTKEGYCAHDVTNTVFINQIDMDKLYGVTFCAVKDPRNLTFPDFLVDVKALRPKANSIFVNSKDYQKNYTPVIIGSIIGGMALLIIISLIGFYCLFVKYRHKNRKLGLENSQLKLERGNEYTDFPQAEEHDDWEIDRALLITDEDRKLGSGAFGSVFAGRLLGTPPGYTHALSSALVRNMMVTENQEVAVKRLPEYSDDKSREDFIREIELMKRLGYHERLANLVGCIAKSEPLCLVMEYCSDGDLLHFLSDRCKYMMDLDERGVNYQDGPIDGNYDLSMIITMKQLLMFSVQISYGLEYLSQKGFVHRDVAARNILVHDRKFCKIGDFGLCRFMRSENPHYKCKGGRLPLKWMSPESIRHYDFSTKSDVWAFGILLFEIITLGGAPYPGIKMDELLGFLENGGRIPQPDNCPNEFYDVMRECWLADATRRPDFGVLRQRLAKQLEDVTEEYSYLRLDAQKDYYNVHGNEIPDIILIPEEIPEKRALSTTSTTETEAMDDIENEKENSRREITLSINDLLPEGTEKIELR
ncbi:unnamed protein product [Auanema sp. JU1783]|nr:unnamed protein product [Auanema sp. JU1783]